MAIGLRRLNTVRGLKEWCIHGVKMRIEGGLQGSETAVDSLSLTDEFKEKTRLRCGFKRWGENTGRMASHAGESKLGRFKEWMS